MAREIETGYVFSIPNPFRADFMADIARWNDEHGRA